MFLKTNLGYLSQIALKNMQLLIQTKELTVKYLLDLVEQVLLLLFFPTFLKYDFSKLTDYGNSIEIFPL